MASSFGTSLDVIAILPAAGIGSRMHMDCPKQYLTIGGKTLLEHAIDALLRQDCVRRVIVAVSAHDRYFDTLAIAHDRRVSRVIGGKQRADSVMAGLRLAQAWNPDWVLVHDAARPCLHQDDLARLLAITNHTPIGGILATPVNDTMKRASNAATDRSTEQIATIDHTVERQDLWHALTPQLFPLVLLRDCLTKALAEGAQITDEASALEYCGYQPLLVPGRGDNIKVTRPEDLALATFYFTQLQNDSIAK
ncbi:2-C-methyl-D-erythritol 4-phosphate cytidylyltransferase [Acerihabitans sp. TG2]|uniref:2-C-methyl-D-erythritol 4-phosphate cytidylyltransferase n=1 Tax=Acerihabitans sp. TG2 TaxID=3096008 RepID=UPI002B23E82B|nr:2-C-methyl-D-erythritol 4-phosphate cytidylyltransferase [Acerihabitans sp. TG2]MEA9392763.1 2-C-methyl-D-erythritol 4-phosphate cytidylyltransferase [Acerihabitans sp. TG2]